MKLYLLDSHDPTVNLAVEEILAREADEPLFMLWRNGPSIIVGKNQNTAAEIDTDFVRDRNIPVVRRITGGGAVYHDLGNVNYSCISLEREWGEESASVFTRPIVEALNVLRIQAAYSGRNDIIANGRKVSGCARSVPKDHTLFHGTLLFDTDLDVLTQALRPDPEKIRSKGIKSVRARVGNLRDMLPDDLNMMTVDDFLNHLTRFIGNVFDGEGFTQPPTHVLEQAQKLAQDKYRTWDWNYGTPITYEVTHKKHCAAGIVQADFNVKDNKIHSLHFSGDFFGSYPIDPLVQALNGQYPRRDELLAAIQPFPLQDYIAGISPEELVELLTI